MPNWTPSQANAIAAQNCNLLVSAGAGSGKTTVLTQRIIERIRQGASVSDFLVVTFTKASAADLKSKLYDAITRLAAENPSEGRYRSQLYLLPNARISTIDSFCLEIVRANFQTLGISPNVRMADEEESRMLADDALDAVIDAFYESGDEWFALLADTFSGTKDDGPLSETMYGLYGQLRAYADYFGWLEEKGNALLEDAQRMENGLFTTVIGARLQKRLVDWLTELEGAAEALFDTVYAAASDPKTAETAALWRGWCGRFRQAAAESYRAFVAQADEFAAFSFPRLSTSGLPAETKAFYKDERDRIQKELKGLVKSFACGSEQEQARQFDVTGRIVLAIKRFLERFEAMYAQAKREKGVLDFPDAEHGMLRLLEQNGQPTPLCLSLRQSIQEIYIDEYQDVSPLQDRLFTLLSRGNNRFMVGDVKQSIYRFRNAYPDIFLDYKDRFADYPQPSAEGNRIFLRENFRSEQPVLEFTNLLFARVTAGTPYEREYKGEELVFAKPSACKAQPVTVVASPYSGLSKKAATELEAAYIAEEILRLVESGVRETADGKVPYRYGDVVLLFRALQNSTLPYERAFRERGIPFSVKKAEPFFDRQEIGLVLAFLRAVDDPTDDISLFAAMRSPLGHFTADEIYQLRQRKMNGTLFSAVQAAAEQEQEGGHCRSFLAFLERMRAEARGKPCHAFLWDFYTASGLLHICTPKEKKGLLLLYEYARRFETTGYKGLFGFLAYLEAARKKGVDLQGAKESGETDCVTLTTIHSSKGLEYPVVFLCNCDHKLSAGTQRPYTLLRGDGLFFKLRDYERLTVTDTLLHRYAAIAEQDAELGEELRKLYVACTRAREKLYITGAASRNLLAGGNSNPKAPRNIMELVLYAACKEAEPSYERITLSAEEVGFHMAGEQAEAAKAGAPFLTQEVREAIGFVYPHKTNGMPAKVSVSELKQGLFGEQAGEAAVTYTEQKLVRCPSFLQQTAESPAATDVGTANHVFLQFCDFSAVEQNGIHAEVERLLRIRMLAKEQVDMLDEAGLRAFFAGGLYARMRACRAAGRGFWREQRFSVCMNKIHAEDDGDAVLVQGVIDCFFAEEDGSITVVDYKTDRVKSGAELKRRHAPQLECYRKAVEAMLRTADSCPQVNVTLWSFALGEEIPLA